MYVKIVFSGRKMKASKTLVERKNISFPLYSGGQGGQGFIVSPNAEIDFIYNDVSNSLYLSSSVSIVSRPRVLRAGFDYRQV
jgi:hypothetical protein